MGVAAKASSIGELIVPKTVLAGLKTYASTATHVLREAKANQNQKNSLLPTRWGQHYKVKLVNRLWLLKLLHSKPSSSTHQR